MPRYRVHILTSLYSTDVEAGDEINAKLAALADPEYDYVYGVQAEYNDSTWRVCVEELAEVPKEDLE